jgi:hypothetical protein
VTEPRYTDDQSLQSWGRNLGGIKDAAAEVARLYAEAEAAKERLNAVVGKMRDQGETDLPASDQVVAEVQSLHQRATAATSADEWRSIVADAETLPGTYRREHETDEDRVHAPRRSLAAEKRADVSHAASEL